MADKPTYEELELRIEKLEKEAKRLTQAEEGLRESQYRYGLIFNGSRDAIFLTGADAKFVDVNDAASVLTGYSKSELKRMSIPDLHEKADLHAYETYFKSIMAGKSALSEAKILKKDGTKVDTEFSNTRITISGIPFMHTVARDITDRKQTEKALRESKERYRAVVESQTEMICRFLPDGTITFVNDAYCHYFDKDCKELIGHKFMPLIPESDRDKVFKGIASLNPNTPVITHEHRVLNPNGEICWHKWTNRAIFDDQNKLMEYQSVGWDITQRYLAEKALKESENRYRRLVETMSDGLGIQDENGFITYVNNKFCQMLDYKSDDIIGKSVTHFLDDHNSQILKNQTSIRKKDKVTPYEIEWTCKDGRKIQTIMSPQAIFNDNGQFKGSFSVVTDVSILKRAEELLRKKTHDLGERVKELNCLYGISKIRERPDIAFEEMLQEIVDLIPPSWQYPEITCARIIMEGQEYKTKNFKETVWKLASNIVVHDKQIGILEICYLKEKPESDEGPFQKEERSLIGAITERLGRVTEHKRAEGALRKAHHELERRVKERTRELEIKQKGLEEINTAMTVLLKKREEDKTELEDNVLTNVKELVEPYFEKIKKTKLDDQQKAFLSIMEYNLNEIISPFTRKMSLKYLNLTPTEIRIANLIRHGSPSKKIAELLNVSPRTIDTHRKNIRRKIGLQGQRGNLRSHLLSLH